MKNYKYKIKRKPFLLGMLKMDNGELLTTIKFEEAETAEGKKLVLPEIYSFSATFNNSDYCLIRVAENERIFYKLTKDGALVGQIPHYVFGSFTTDCIVETENNESRNKELNYDGKVGGWSKKISFAMYDETGLLFKIHDGIFGVWKIESLVPETDKNFPVLLMMFISAFSIARPTLLWMRIGSMG